MAAQAPKPYTLANGCRISHGQSHIRKPFADIDLQMNELCRQSAKGFSGQLGYIEFSTAYRLPRHIHMDLDTKTLVDERIMVLHGVALVEIAGTLYAVGPGTLVDIPGGVPHTWTASPAGVKLPDGTVSSGTFTMVYEYESPTRFFPTASTDVVTDPAEYKAFDGEFDEIRIARLSAQEVVNRCSLVYNNEPAKLQLA
ncbi:hypothetical protein K4F52_001799 [Lecanicillium sp. MT-2017a]|nr:hypothetical protein K4F52_001799 [Lecanicillium sp. MT-2017a]